MRVGVGACPRETGAAIRNFARDLSSEGASRGIRRGYFGAWAPVTGMVCAGSSAPRA